MHGSQNAYVASMQATQQTMHDNKPTLKSVKMA